jgi:ParB family chromosome partitioning protein
LAYDDDPATRDLLLNLLADDDDPDVTGAAFTAARKLFGEASLEPHYARIQNPSAEDSEDGTSVRLLGDRGDAGRVFQILPKIGAEHQDTITTRLLNRVPLPVAEAAAALPAGDAGSVRVAARILGRAGPAAAKAAGAKVGPALADAIGRWRKAWDERRERVGPSGASGSDAFGAFASAMRRAAHVLPGGLTVLDRTIADGDVLTQTVQTLLWCAGRLGMAQEAVVAAASARAADPHYRPIRLEAVSALAAGDLSGAALSAIESAAVGDDPDVRALAADVLATQQPKRAAALADQVLSDRVSFNRLAMDMRPTGKSGGGDGLRPALRTAAAQGHYQGIALPHLVSAADLATLSAVADDRKLPEATRLGAVEGLGRLAAEPAEAKLRVIGANDKEEETVRKAAWRALRRSKRARAGAVSAAVT